MKKNWIVLLCAVVIMIAGLAIVFSQNHISGTPAAASSDILDYSTSKAPSSQESSEIIAMTSKSNVYIVKEYEGHIGIFYNDESKPYEEIQVDVSSLPEADRKLLKEGIKVTDTDRLNSIIEDYES
ncbi:MAG: BofC-C domain-containing protein [Eubacteriales bacterium]